MYFSKQAVKLAIEKISSVHPFFGITFLSAKKNELTIGNKMNCSIDTWNKTYLDTFHKLNPNSSYTAGQERFRKGIYPNNRRIVCSKR